MNTNTNTAGRAKGAKATTNTNTTKATKATTSNTSAAKMDAAAIATTAAAVLKKYGTISAIKATAAALREKYGASNWAGILSRCKEFRAADIKEAYDAARGRVFSYRTILGTTFRALSADKDYQRLCKYAAATYKGTDTDTAAALVRDYYGNVDATSGAPLSLTLYADTARGLIYSAYIEKELTDTAALAVLKGALQGLKAAALKASRKGTDATAAAGVAVTMPDNKRNAGAIAGVWECDADAHGLFIKGAPLTGKAATTDKIKAAAVTSAAALIGRAVPADCAKLAELNATAKAAYNAAAEKAYNAEKAALKADAAAAGVATAPRPKKAAKDAAKARAAAASIAKIDAAIKANNADAAALAASVSLGA